MKTAEQTLLGLRDSKVMFPDLLGDGQMKELREHSIMDLVDDAPFDEDEVSRISWEFRGEGERVTLKD